MLIAKTRWTHRLPEAVRVAVDAALGLRRLPCGYRLVLVPSREDPPEEAQPGPLAPTVFVARVVSPPGGRSARPSSPTGNWRASLPLHPDTGLNHR